MMSTIANVKIVTTFCNYQIVMQIKMKTGRGLKSNSNAICPKRCIQIAIHLMSYIKVKKVGVTSQEIKI